MDQSMPMYPHTHRSQTLSQLPYQRIGMHIQAVSLTTVKGNVEKTGSPTSKVACKLQRTVVTVPTSEDKSDNSEILYFPSVKLHAP